MLDPIGEPALRAWIRRPGALRVEPMDGSRVQTTRAARPFDGMMHRHGDGPWEPTPGRWPAEVTPVVDEYGLVTALPAEDGRAAVDWDDPMHQSYQWVAMLNPVELAEQVHSGGDVDGGVVGAVTELSPVTVTTHHGRPVWEATATPTWAYDPRCDCCPLLTGLYDEEAHVWVPGPPSLVRLDVGTGVCVYLGPVGS